LNASSVEALDRCDRAPGDGEEAIDDLGAEYVGMLEPPAPDLLAGADKCMSYDLEADRVELVTLFACGHCHQCGPRPEGPLLGVERAQTRRSADVGPIDAPRALRGDGGAAAAQQQRR
jgi:hypothetical protein